MLESNDPQFMLTRYKGNGKSIKSTSFWHILQWQQPVIHPKDIANRQYSVFLWWADAGEDLIIEFCIIYSFLHTSSHRTGEQNNAMETNHVTHLHIIPNCGIHIWWYIIIRTENNHSNFSIGRSESKNFISLLKIWICCKMDWPIMKKKEINYIMTSTCTLAKNNCYFHKIHFPWIRRYKKWLVVKSSSNPHRYWYKPLLVCDNIKLRKSNSGRLVPSKMKTNRWKRKINLTNISLQNLV